MTDPINARCPRCAAVLPPNAPEGLCPRCLGALHLATETVPPEAEPAPAQPPLTPAELAPHFPQLEILACLGRGGMGVVYKARQKSLNRLVALKLLAPERVTDAGFAERFVREAQALARLNHPSIVTVHDFGATRAGGLQPPTATPPPPSAGDVNSPSPQTPDAIPHPPFFYLLMEFVDGVNLRQAMKAGRFTPEQALAIVPPVCEALQYAHEHGIVHRDIKPENLLLDKSGRVKIADFGIAKMLHSDGDTPVPQPIGEPGDKSVPLTLTAAGTPQYMAPEQKAHTATDHRADIYSLGVVLYELLTGELPADKLQPPSRKVQIDVRLDEIVLRALEARPELRYQTAGEFRTQLVTMASTPPPVPAEPRTGAPPPPRFRKIGTSTLTTPAEIATARGQFFCYRTRGQLILDNHQLTHTCASLTTIIPLAAIRDVSIGQYPRSMNPAGLPVLSVTYEEGGQRRQILLSPMEGFFAFPATWDARVTEWFHALRDAVTDATGRTPGQTPADQLGVPRGGYGLLIAMFCGPAIFGLLAVWLLSHQRGAGNGPGLPLLAPALLLLFVPAMAALGWCFVGRSRSGSPISLGRSAFGLGLMLVGLALAGFQLREASQAHFARFTELSAQIPRLQQQWHTVLAEENAARAKLNRFEATTPVPTTDPERQARALERGRLDGEMSQARARRDTLNTEIQTTHDTINQLAFPNSRALAHAAVWGLPLILLGLALIFWRTRPSPAGPTASSQRSGLFVLSCLAVFGGIVLLQFVAQPGPPTGVTHCEVIPVGVSNNVVIVDLITAVGRWSAELRAGLTGPRLPGMVEAALTEQFDPPFGGTFVKPSPHLGNQPWRIQPAGTQTWRLGFALPDAALAQQALRNLRPIGPLPAEPDRAFAGTLFEVRQTNGQEFHATLQVSLPVTSGDSNWVTVSAMTSYNESAVTMNWELLASQPGTARFQREGNRSSMQLQLDAKTKLYRAPVRLELTKVSANRVLLVTQKGGVTTREEFPGNFRDLSAELLRFKHMSAKTVRGASIELCQFQGNPFTVQVDAPVPPLESNGVRSVPGRPVVGIVVVVLIAGAFLAGLALVIVLVRKGGQTRTMVLSLGSAALAMFIGVIVALFGWRAVRVSQPPKFAQMALEANYPGHSAANPPGRVLQAQNGFRLQLPARQLASFEFFLRQPDDSWQSVPSLTALVATGTNGGYHDTLHWTLRRSDTLENTNQLWFWSVSANANGGRPLPQLTDHGTNFTHVLGPGEQLDWWQLTTPARVELKPGEEQIIPLFRPHGTATVHGTLPKEAFVRVRCEPLPARLVFAPGFRTEVMVEAGLAAHALLAKVLPAPKPAPATARKISHDISPITSSIVGGDNRPEAIAAAQQRGIATATEDIQAGVFRILRYGSLMPTSPEDKDEETGYRILWVAGSFIGNAFLAETDAYNFAMRQWYWKHRPPAPASAAPPVVPPAPKQAEPPPVVAQFEGRAVQQFRKGTTTGYGGYWEEFYHAYREPRKDTNGIERLVEVRHGPMVTFDREGHKRFAATYRHGLRDGLFTMWNEAGGRTAEIENVAGKVHGRSTEWDNQGRKWREQAYRDDLMEGETICWDKHGLVDARGTYRAGKPWEGTFHEYKQRDGKSVLLVCTYQAGVFTGEERPAAER